MQCLVSLNSTELSELCWRMQNADESGIQKYVTLYGPVAKHYVGRRRRLTATVRGNLLQRFCQYPRDSTAHVKTLGPSVGPPARVPLNFLCILKVPKKRTREPCSRTLWYPCQGTPKTRSHWLSRAGCTRTSTTYHCVARARGISPRRQCYPTLRMRLRRRAGYHNRHHQCLR